MEATSNVGNELKGMNVIGRSGRQFGRISDFILNGDDDLDAVIVETMGVLGIGIYRLTVKVDSLDPLVDPYDQYFPRVRKPVAAKVIAAISETSPRDLAKSVSTGKIL